MISDQHFLPLKPEIFNDFNCPRCGAGSPHAVRPMVLGKQTAAEYRCDGCGLAFVRDLPAGFTIQRPLAFSLDDRHPFHPEAGKAEEWQAYPEYQVPREDRYNAQRHVFRKCSKVVILNTIDYLYGHVLLKLFNAQHYIENHPDIGLVVIVPKMFEWLVPKGVAETWVFDMKLADAWGWNAGIDFFVREQWPNYEEIYLARGYSHPDFTKIDIGNFSGIKPFDILQFREAPKHVTFVARRDRLWYPNPLAKFAHRVQRKLRLLPGTAVWWQDRMVARAIRKIKRQYPETTFTVVGLGTPGGMPSGVEDLRTGRMDLETEKAWCRAYAKSQVVVGVHGSNMLLPTAHSAGCVEILPYDRYGNMVQDVAVRYNDRMQLFMYRFVDEFASPGMVARHVNSMFKEFSRYYRNNRINIFDPWPKLPGILS